LRNRRYHRSDHHRSSLALLASAAFMAEMRTTLNTMVPCAQC
jgi:hypothetical protein